MFVSQTQCALSDESKDAVRAKVNEHEKMSTLCNKKKVNEQG